MSHRNSQQKLGMDLTDFLIPSSMPSMEGSTETGRCFFTRERSTLTRERSSLRKSRRKSSGLYKTEFDLMDIERERTTTPKTARIIAEKHAELEVEHNWLLKEEDKRQKEKLIQTKVKLSICLPEEDPLDSINQRLVEIQSMVKPRAEIPSFITNLSPEQRQKIMTVSKEDVEERKERRRKQTKLVETLRHVFKMLKLINRTCIPRKKFNTQHNDNSTQQTNTDDEEDKPTAPRSSLSFEVQLALSSSPEHRTSKDLKRITWVLRATRAYKHLFPDELERDLAQIVAYERYEDDRLIASQERAPERFYYVLSGRIQKLREYQLSSGCVYKSMGHLNKGTCSDTEELIKQCPREYHLVAKGPVEVLILHREDFIRLKHTTHGPPLEFLRSVDLFSEFPCEELLSRPDAIDFKYYGQNAIVAKDALNTPWIHVIKSGHVKVVRIQYVIDVSNDSIFEGQSADELGCGRAFSHASAMLGVLAKQRELKALKEEEEEDVTENTFFNYEIKSGPKTKTKTPRSVGQNEIKLPNIRIRQPSEDLTAQLTAKTSVTLPPIVQAAMSGCKVGEGFHSHGTFLTREKTETETVLPSRSMKKEQSHRRAYLQLDVLSAGDIFGLESLDTQPSGHLLHEGPAVSLMSEGAEVIKINKRFFLQHAQNNTILKVETLQREFLTTEEVKSILYDQETWTQYKQILMQKLTTNLTPRRSQIGITLGC